MFGKAMVASWRPYETGGGGGAQMRSSQIECDSVTVLDQIVLAQHPDGFWETFPLSNCAIIWSGKPAVSIIVDGKDTALAIEGKEHTLADELAQHEHIKQMRFSVPHVGQVTEEEVGLA
jgi:hypothetical protein